MPVIRKDFGHLCLTWCYHFFRTKHYLYGNQLWAAPGVLERFDSVFGCESPHNQCQLTIGCHLDGCQINPLYVFGGASTTSIHFHNKLRIFHGFSLLLLYADERGSENSAILAWLFVYRGQTHEEISVNAHSIRSTSSRITRIAC